MGLCALMLAWQTFGMDNVTLQYAQQTFEMGN